MPMLEKKPSVAMPFKTKKSPEVIYFIKNDLEDDMLWFDILRVCEEEEKAWEFLDEEKRLLIL